MNNSPDSLKVFQVNWSLTHRCNYSCLYCFNQNGIEKSFNLSDVIIERIFKNIKDYAADFEKFRITLTGGEPTLLSELPLIIQYIRESFNLEYVNFITNCSKIPEYFSQFLRYAQKDDFFIRCSLHPDYWNNNTKNVINSLLKNKINHMVSILFDPSKIAVVQDMINFVQPESCPSLRRIFGCDSIQYSEDDLRFLKEINSCWGNSEEITNTIETNKFRGKTCHFGDNLLIINSDLSFSPGYCPQAEIVKLPFAFINARKIREKIKKTAICRQSCCQIPTDLCIPKSF